MKKLFIAVAFLTTAFIARAQNKKTDSLIAALNVLPDNAQRIPILKQLSGQENDATNIFKYGNEGLQLAAKLGLQKDEEAFLAALAGGYFKTGNYPKDLEISFKGLALSEKLMDTLYICRFLNGIGVSYDDANDPRKGLNYVLQGLQLAVKLKNKSRIEAFYVNIGDFYQDLNLLDSALYYEKVGLRIAKEINDPNIGYPLIGLGYIENKLNHPRLALSYCYQSIPFFSKIDFYRVKNVSGAYEVIAEIYKKTSHNDSAFFYADAAYKLASKGKELFVTHESAALLSVLYEGRNDKESLRYLKIATAANDSLNSAGKAKQFQLLNFQQQQQENDVKAAAKTYRENLRLYGIVLVLIVALVISGILWNSYKKQQTANKLLRQQQDELKATQNQLIQSEKMASLGELTAGIAHEIQNPLNFVNNFAEVNAEMIGELEEELKTGNIKEALVIAADIKENEQKISHHGKRADAIVKGMLQHSQASSGSKEFADINALADEYIRLAYHGLRAKDKTFNAEIITRFDAQLPRVKVIPQDIGRVLLNLFNNAFYAVKEKGKTAGPGYRPEVSVTTSAENGNIIIRVKDNGTGIPDNIKEKIMQPFFTTKPTGEGTGLGLSLTYDMVVKGHNGAISVDTREGEYTEFTITLPLS